MTIQAVLLPLFVEVVLTFALLFVTAHLRVSAVRAREVKVREIALRQPNWPVHATQVANAYNNQLELPVLFYVLIILAWITHQADIVFIALAWVFVISRLVHAAIHVTSNHVGRRFGTFAVGAIVLAVMWGIFIVRVLLMV
jgi:hypothetical protein